MANGIYIGLLRGGRSKGNNMPKSGTKKDAFRRNFGPKQVRDIKEIKKDKKYVAVYGAGAREEFLIIEGPFKVEKNWYVRVKINLGGPIIYKKLNLYDFNIVPDENGGWNQYNYIERIR